MSRQLRAVIMVTSPVRHHVDRTAVCNHILSLFILSLKRLRVQSTKSLSSEYCAADADHLLAGAFNGCRLADITCPFALQGMPGRPSRRWLIGKVGFLGSFDTTLHKFTVFHQNYGLLGNGRLDMGVYLTSHAEPTSRDTSQSGRIRLHETENMVKSIK